MSPIDQKAQLRPRLAPLGHRREGREGQRMPLGGRLATVAGDGRWNWSAAAAAAALACISSPTALPLAAAAAWVAALAVPAAPWWL